MKERETTKKTKQDKEHKDLNKAVKEARERELDDFIELDVRGTCGDSPLLGS